MTWPQCLPGWLGRFLLSPALKMVAPAIGGFRMPFVVFFSLGGATTARYPIANSVLTNEANSDDHQQRKELLDKAKHLSKAHR